MFFKEKDYVMQVDESDCGVACLSMILKHYNSSVSIAYLRNIAKTDNEGTTALGIVEAAKAVGMKTKAIKAGIDLLDNKNLPCPFIVHVIKDKEILHYYVVLKVNKKTVVIGDPDPTVRVTKISRTKFEQEWTGVALFISPGESYNEIHQKQRTLFSLFLGLKNKKKLLVEIILLALLITIISIMGSYFLQVTIDFYIPRGMNATLTIIVLGLISAYFFQAIFSYMQNILLTILGQKLSREINLDYIKHIFKLPMDFFATRKTGEIVSRFEDASKIIDALASTVITVFLNVGIVLIVGGVLAFQNFKLFLVTVTSLPIYVIVILAFAKKFELLNRKEMESESVLNSTIIEDINGVETIKALNGENLSYKKINREYEEFLNKGFKYSKSDILQQAIKLFIQLFLEVAVLWLGAIFIMKGSFSVGRLMSYNALLAYFVNPLQDIINMQPKLQSARVANTRLNEILLVESEFKKKRPIVNLETNRMTIEFKNVSYHYGYGEEVLKNINMRINSGEKIAIVGMSGSGKSTLVKLLVNFFSPSEGQIFINSKAIELIDKHTLRKMINYIPQNPYIFSGTIEDNLRLGSREDITIEDIELACKVALIGEDIEKMPLRLKTVLDEGGNTLSGGQKQRITIARALLSPAKVLVFDESTSGLDTITEKKLVDNLVNLPNKTVIFIAHRLAVAKKTDYIFVLNNGKLVEQGKNDELVRQHGYYFNLLSA